MVRTAVHARGVICAPLAAMCNPGPARGLRGDTSSASQSGWTGYVATPVLGDGFLRREEVTFRREGADSAGRMLVSQARRPALKLSNMIR
jgi:hypothetical protein